MKGFPEKYSIADVARMAGVRWTGDHEPASAGEPTAWRCVEGHAFLASKTHVLRQAKQWLPACPKCAAMVRRTRRTVADDRRSHTQAAKARSAGRTVSTNGISLYDRSKQRKTSNPKPVVSASTPPDAHNPKVDVYSPPPIEPLLETIEPTLAPERIMPPPRLSLARSILRWLFGK